MPPGATPKPPALFPPGSTLVMRETFIGFTVLLLALALYLAAFNLSQEVRGLRQAVEATAEELRVVRSLATSP